MTTDELHAKAMEAANKAQDAMIRSNAVETQRHYEDALKWQLEAAQSVADIRSQPLRSTLYRTAAVLALQVGKVELAGDLALQGRLGNPPPNIDAELKAIYRSATGVTLP